MIVEIKVRIPVPSQVRQNNINFIQQTYILETESYLKSYIQPSQR